MPKRRHAPLFALPAVIDDSYRYGAKFPRKAWEYLRDIILAFSGERRRRWAEYLAMEKQAEVDRFNYEKMSSSLVSGERHRRSLAFQVTRLEQKNHGLEEEIAAANRQVDVHARVITQQRRDREAITAEVLAFKMEAYETIRLAAACLDVSGEHGDVLRGLIHLQKQLEPTIQTERK